MSQLFVYPHVDKNILDMKSRFFFDFELVIRLKIEE